MAKSEKITDRCTQYALDVVAGKVTAGGGVKKVSLRGAYDLVRGEEAPHKNYFFVFSGKRF